MTPNTRTYTHIWSLENFTLKGERAREEVGVEVSEFLEMGELLLE